MTHISMRAWKPAETKDTCIRYSQGIHKGNALCGKEVESFLGAHADATQAKLEILIPHARLPDIFSR